MKLICIFAFFKRRYMFSKTCEYAIRAIIFIAQRTCGGSRVGIKEIAKNIASPEHFIAKVLQDMVRSGLILSAKGPHGGFYMDEHCINHTLAEIVEATDGNKIFSGCALGLKKCSEEKPCPIHHKYKAIREDIRYLMESTTVTELVNNPNVDLSYLRR